MLNRRQILESAAASGLLFLTDRRAFAQTATVYPGGYTVHSGPGPESKPSFVKVREGRLEGILSPEGLRYFRGTHSYD